MNRLIGRHLKVDQLDITLAKEFGYPSNSWPKFGTSPTAQGGVYPALLREDHISPRWTDPFVSSS